MHEANQLPPSIQRGITGLETAIILIAFVVVASVFSFTMLSTGVFASEQANASVLSALEQATGSISSRGSVIAFKGRVGSSSDSDTIYKVSVIVTNSSGGSSVDMTPPYSSDDSGFDPDFDVGSEYSTVISYSDQFQYLSDVPWTGDWIGENDSDYLLESGEYIEISIWLLRRDFVSQPAKATANNGVSYWISPDPKGAVGMTSNETIISRNNAFNLEIKTEYGSTLVFQRRAPSVLDSVMNLR
jgi:flagellin FlaB